ncbi:MAG: histidinol-phosphatase HisJ family protein [Tissierellia bacterium]|nr:histidinol-phosphatase HisJ family protein [Tissierellia bacterium]
MIDTHSHCRYSMDSMEEPRKNIEAAIEGGLKVLAFTDHVDRYEAGHPLDYIFDVEAYFKELRQLKEEYRRDLKILLGVEIGMRPAICEAMDEFVSQYPFDYVIGSIHALADLDIAVHARELAKNPHQSYQIYLEETLTCVREMKNFHILGHMDYLDRYLARVGTVPPYEDFQELTTEILKALIQSGRGLELNTAGLRKGLSYYNPKDEILKQYRKLGGEIITLSSDAHFARDIGYHHQVAADHLRALGFQELSYYEGGQRKTLPLAQG